MAELHPHVEIAQRLSTCLVHGDAEGVAALYDQDAIVWRNIDERGLTRDQVLKVIRFLTHNVTDLRYEEIRVLPTPEGFVQQHVLRGIAPDGERLNVHTCLVATIANGKIHRLEEYLDSSALQPLMKP